MRSFSDDISGPVVSVLALVMVLTGILMAAFVVAALAGIGWLCYQGYKHYQKRHDRPQLGPWSEGGNWTGFPVISERMPLGNRVRWK